MKLLVIGAALLALAAVSALKSEAIPRKLNGEAATVTEIHRNGKTAEYTVKWDKPPTDVDKLDVNTLKITKGGTYRIKETRTSDGAVDPTTAALDRPFEVTSLTDEEKAMVKTGTITIIVSNPESSTLDPKLLAVTCDP